MVEPASAATPTSGSSTTAGGFASPRTLRRTRRRDRSEEREAKRHGVCWSHMRCSRLMRWSGRHAGMATTAQPMYDRTVDLIAASLFALALAHTFAAKQLEHLAQRFPRHQGLLHLLG